MEKIIRRTLEDVLTMMDGLDKLASGTRLKAHAENDRPTVEWTRGYMKALESLRTLINEELKVL